MTTVPTATHDDTVHTLSIQKAIEIAAPVDITFAAVLEELGPGGEMPDGTPFPMTFEPWPGGRWFRDLGKGTGHFWGHVQVFKPHPHPRPLIEICGPMFMSYPAVNFVQYRLVPEGRDGSGTLLTITHRAMGLIPAADREGVVTGWDHGLKRVREIAARIAAAKR